MSQVEARTVLWYLVLIGFAVNYMLRINLNISIVEMIAANSRAKKLTVDVNHNLEIISNQLQTSANRIDSIHNISYLNQTQLNGETPIGFIENKKFSIEKFVLDYFQINYERDGFHWNEYQQGLVLGSFFWLHWITQIPGGILAKKFGTKIVFGLSNAIGCWLCILMPFVAYYDYKALILLRVLQGLICGLAWPAMHNMTARWIPPNERSKFVSAYLGSSVGIAVFYPLFGYVISWSSWEWVFHICGLIGTLWYIGWVCLVFDTPSEHPRISQTELRYIEKSLGTSVHRTNQEPTPWSKIFKSLPVWMNVVAQWGGIWGLFTLMTQAPTYFKTMHHWSIKSTGVLSGLPHLMRMLFALTFSMFGDYLLRTEKMSRTNVRKLATTMCCIVNGILVLGLAYFGHDAIAAVVFLTIATMVHGAVSSGPLASIVDIAPNHAGVVLGISGMIGVLPGFISPVVVGYLTLGNQTLESWKYVFIICAVMLIGSGILYVIFCESTLQSWNSPKEKDLDKEMALLNDKKIEKKNENIAINGKTDDQDNKR